MARALLLLVSLQCCCLVAKGFVLQPTGLVAQRIARGRRCFSLHAVEDSSATGGDEAKDDHAKEDAKNDAKPVPSLPNAGISIQEGSLPISYRSDDGTRDAEFYLDAAEKGNLNPYFDVVRRLSPTELIGRFMRTGSPKVQEAVKTTVLGLLGSLPRQAFETATLTTGDALANLMFQLQMTGYMFKNAEYRMSLQNSLRSGASEVPKGLITGATLEGVDASSLVPMDEDGNIIIKKPTISGKVKLTYESGQEVEVDASAYMAELATQVHALQTQLATAQSKQQEAESKDLLMYIRSMPESQLRSLSEGISEEVLESMKMLVETVMRSMGGATIGRQTITQQSGQGMAQLCMWQLAVGYNLREMEAREEIKKRFEAAE